MTKDVKKVRKDRIVIRLKGGKVDAGPCLDQLIAAGEGKNTSEVVRNVLIKYCKATMPENADKWSAAGCV